MILNIIIETLKTGMLKQHLIQTLRTQTMIVIAKCYWWVEKKAQELFADTTVYDCKILQKMKKQKQTKQNFIENAPENK